MRKRDVRRVIYFCQYVELSRFINDFFKKKFSNIVKSLSKLEFILKKHYQTGFK